MFTKKTAEETLGRTQERVRKSLSDNSAESTNNRVAGSDFASYDELSHTCSVRGLRDRFTSHG